MKSKVSTNKLLMVLIRALKNAQLEEEEIDEEDDGLDIELDKEIEEALANQPDEGEDVDEDVDWEDLDLAEGDVNTKRERERDFIIVCPPDGPGRGKYLYYCDSEDSPSCWTSDKKRAKHFRNFDKPKKLADCLVRPKKHTVPSVKSHYFPKKPKEPKKEENE